MKQMDVVREKWSNDVVDEMTAQMNSIQEIMYSNQIEIKDSLTYKHVRMELEQKFNSNKFKNVLLNQKTKRVYDASKK